MKRFFHCAVASAVSSRVIISDLLRDKQAVLGRVKMEGADIAQGVVLLREKLHLVPVEVNRMSLQFATLGLSHDITDR